PMPRGSGNENSPGGAQFTSLDHWLDPLEMCASGGFAPGWCVGIGAVVSQQKEMWHRFLLSMGTCRWGVVSPRRGSLLGPRQTDFGVLDLAAIKVALSGLEGHVNHRPVSVQLDEPAAVHRPQETRAGGIIEGP